MAIMQIKNLNNMVGNFKISLLILLMFSCKNKQETKQQIGISIINQNFEVLMNSVSYFDLSKVSKNVKEDINVNLNAEVMAMDVEESEKMFKTKFKLEQEKIDPIFFKIKKIPVNKISNYPIILVSNVSKSKDSVNVGFMNFLIDSSSKFSSITVITSRGIGAKFEIYYFKKVKGKWAFVGKELLALG